MYMAHCVWASEILQEMVGGWMVVGPRHSGLFIEYVLISLVVDQMVKGQK